MVRLLARFVSFVAEVKLKQNKSKELESERFTIRRIRARAGWNLSHLNLAARRKSSTLIGSDKLREAGDAHNRIEREHIELSADRESNRRIG